MSDLRLQVLLSAVDKATKPMRDILAGSKGMGKALSEAREQFKGLNEAQRNIEGFRVLRANVRANDAALKASAATTKSLQEKMAGLRDAHGPLAGQVRTARTEMKRIAEQMRATTTPTAELNRDYAIARDRLSQLEGKYNTSTNAIRRTREQVRIVGQHTGALTIKQRRLAESLASAKAKLDAAGIGTERLSAKNRELRANMAQATATIDEQKGALVRLNAARAKLGAARETAGKLRSAGTSAVIGGGVAALPLIKGVKDALAFESAMADVRKVVDFDTPEQFAQMARDIQDLSTQLPLAQEDIAAIVAAAGQSNVARKDLLAFARDAAQMGIAFDISASDAGETMAKFRTAFRLSQPEVVALADKINFLGNTTAAGTGPITDIVRRIGALGDVAGLNSGAVTALGATVASMGVTSETGATGIKNLMLSLTSGTAATKKQKLAFDELGISAVDVAKAMQEDASGAIIDVLERLRELPKAQQSATLTRLFGRESVGAIAPLLTNLDALKENLAKVSDETRFGGSMFKEFVARASTVGNVLELTKNAAGVTSTEMGQTLLPIIKDLATGAISAFQSITRWMRAHPVLTGVIVKTAAALALLVTGIGAMLITVSAIIGPLALLRFSLVGIGIRMPTLAAAFRAMPATLGTMRASLLGASAAMRGLNLAMLANPVGLVVAAIAAGALLVIKFWEPIKAFFTGLFSGIADGFAPLATVFAPLAPVFGMIGRLLKGIGDLFTWIVGPINFSAQSLGTVANIGKALGFAISTFVITPFQVLGDLIGWLAAQVTAVLGGAFETFAGLLTGDLSRASNGLTEWVGGVVGIFAGVPLKLLGFGQAMIDGLVSGITSRLGAVKDAVVGAAGSVGDWFKDKLGINSPSRVFTEFGQFTLDGLAQGLRIAQDGPLAVVSALAARLRQAGAGIALGSASFAAAATGASGTQGAAPVFDQRPPISAPAAAAASTGSTFNITINAPPGANPQAIAQMVRAEIERYERERAVRGRSRLGD